MCCSSAIFQFFTFFSVLAQPIIFATLTKCRSRRVLGPRGLRPAPGGRAPEQHLPRRGLRQDPPHVQPEAGHGALADQARARLCLPLLLLRISVQVLPSPGRIFNAWVTSPPGGEVNFRGYSIEESPPGGEVKSVLI